jgi:hypothetical protein
MIKSFFPLLIHLVHTKVIYQTPTLSHVHRWTFQLTTMCKSNRRSIISTSLGTTIIYSKNHILHTKSFPKYPHIITMATNVVHLWPPLPPRKTNVYFTYICKIAHLPNFQRPGFKLFKPMHTFKFFFQM